MIKVYRNRSESSEKLIQRFNKKVKNSRLLMAVRELKFFKRKPTKRRQREAAIMREYYRAERKKKMFY